MFQSRNWKAGSRETKKEYGSSTDVYIGRANNAPCGDGVIHLFRGADSSTNQDIRSDLLVFFKGTKVEKQCLKQNNPNRWKFMENVWDIRNSHAVPNLPSQYVFFLKCCKKSGCQHPFCKEEVETPSSWFPGGPSIDYFPIPVPDTSSPGGTMDCSKCSGNLCYGHFLTPELSVQSTADQMSIPPSQIIKEAFDKLKGEDPSDTDVDRLSKATLLPPEEVRIWFEHLSTVQANRKRGAEKAKATRQLKKRQSEATRYYCLCEVEYMDETDEIENWIACDLCNNWFHYECVGVDTDSLPDTFVCA